MRNGNRTIDRAATDKPQPDRPRTRKRAIVIAAGAFLVVAAVAVLFGQFNPFTAEPSPQQVAERYLAARDAYDAEAARALIAPDAVLNDIPVIPIDELDAGFDVLSIYEFSFDPIECSTVENAATSRVTCSYRLHTALSDVVGYPPVAGAMNFEIVDGKITRLDDNFPFLEFSPNVFRPFATWLAIEHGTEAIGELFRILPSGTATSLLDEEARALARSRVAEYRESKGE